MRFTVYLRFVVHVSTPAEIPAVRDYIGRVGHLLAAHAPTESVIRVLDIRQPTLESLILELDVTTNMTRPGELTDDDLRRFGVRNPIFTRANAAVQVWLARIRQTDGGPLQRTWATYCRLTGRDPGPTPLYVLAAGTRPAKIDSPPPPPVTKHDGSTEASARVCGDSAGSAGELHGRSCE
jgi:hypothetical protein